ncbi:vang-like protein 2-B [Lytechinus pictus]|uniref:vang-like protein 2-B n=1 Tax=Lytechinus pictus TaxID=7653 RepID=UPI0030B9F9F1
MDTDGAPENADDNGGFPVTPQPQNQSTRSSKSSKNKYRDRDTDEDSERGHRGRRGRRHRNREDSENDGENRRHSKRHSHVERSVTIATHGATTDEDRDEVIEVQILPQDDNWGDNTTAITGTSDRSSNEDLSRLAKSMDSSIGFDCTRYFPIVLFVVLSLVGFVSPVAFVVIPPLLWEPGDCGIHCDGLFISMAFKLVILAVGSWALFFRKPRSTMPRVYLYRLVMMVAIFVLLLAYWLFFIMRVVLPQDTNYAAIVSYAVSLADALLFMHYIAVIMFELRHLQPVYMLKVVRSPDGMSRYYSIGQLSIQRSAAHVLEHYYRDFQIYNSHLLRVPTTSRVAQKLSNFKFYDVDGGGGNDNVTGHSRAIMTTAAHRRDQSRNERFYEEQEYERRVKKRKARLLVAAEEAFTHIKRVHEDTHPGNHAMDPTEAAQSIFPSLARPLQKYLRITRQQPRWPMDAVMDHLAVCISYNLAPRSFLETFFQPGPNVLLSEHHHNPVQGWELVSDTQVNGTLKEGTTFQLRQGEVLLQVFVMKIPHYKIREEVFDYKKNRFALRLQSETSV